MERQRLDKWLWHARVVKARTSAAALVEAGHVRINGARDRRTKSLHITPPGRRLIRDIAPAVRSTQRLILAPLKAGQRGAFMAMLKHLVHLNNARSRAPLRPKASRRRRSAAATAVKASRASGRMRGQQ